MSRTTPRVHEATLVAASSVADDIAVGTPAWFAWLDQATTFAFAGVCGNFTARKEQRSRTGWYWKAYRKRAGLVRSAYLGKSTDLTLERLNAIASALAGRVAEPPPHEAPSVISPDLSSDFPPLRAAGTSPTPTPAQALSLLTTKLYVPPARPQLVPRPQLLARLDAGLSGKLTLLSAPAGFGKTTLLSAWRATAVGSTLPFAWVSLDTADSDPVRFWSYVIAALDMLLPNSGAMALVLLQSSRPPPIEAVLTPLLNALSTLLTDAVLVLDDYHLIDAAPIHTALTFLLDHLPPRLHLVITTRADPPLPLTRLRVRGQLTELRATDLRFTTDETAAFLTELMGLPLSADDVAALEAHTEGWIAGLQLAALAMRDRSDLAGFIRAFTGSHRFVVDYLAEEVIDRLPLHLQTFVLQTSVLERLCGPLCDALLAAERAVGAGQAYSQVVLEELERANLFLVPLDDERRWYRYHHLFAEVLRARLQSKVSPAEVATLHLRASAWYERQSLISEAIEHAILAHDFERVARLTNEHSERVWRHGGLATLLQWLAVLPDAAIEAHPRLALHHALILAVTDHSQLAEQRIAAAERALLTAPVRDVELLGRAQVVRAIIALLTDLPGEVTIVTGTRALELLPQQDHFWRGFAGLFLGLGYYVQAGDPVAAYRILTEAEQAGIRAGNALCASSAFSHRSIVLEMSGRLRESEHVNRTYLKQASEPAWQGVPLAAYARLGLGRVLYERNELAAAREQILEAIQQLEAWALKRPLIGAYVTLSRLQQALGEAALAREAVERAVAMVQKADLKQTFSQWASVRMRMALMQGDMTAVAEWVQEIEPTTHGELDPALEYKHITLARIYLAQRQLDAAQQLLDRLLPSAQAAGRIGQVLDISLVQALALDAQGQETEAFAALERALILAEPEGYVRTFVDEGAPMAALLAQVARGKAPVAAYAASLMEAFPRTEPLERRHSVLSPRFSALIEPLSARELEILRLIADGHSNQAIADTLVIAVSTVKRHINNIFGKLAVQSRTQALLRARELQLL